MKNATNLIFLIFIFLSYYNKVFICSEISLNNGKSDGNAQSNHVNPTESPILMDLKDVDRLARLVLMRGHIIIDPTHRVGITESRLDQLIEYLYENNLRNAMTSIHATEDRELGCDNMPIHIDNLRKLCNIVTQDDCLSASDMIVLVPQTPTNDSSIHQTIARVCPLILFKLTRPICRDEYEMHHNQEEEEKRKRYQLEEPSDDRVWGFGVLFVTLSIVVSMGGLIVVPFLKRDARRYILTLFEGLAVGGLTGSAIFHLFPQAFDIVDDKFQVYFWHIFLIFIGVYFFYLFEIVLKILIFMKGKTKRKRTPSLNQFEEKDLVLSMPLVGFKPPLLQTQQSQSNENEMTITAETNDQFMKLSNSLTINPREAVINSTRGQLTQCLATVSAPPSSNAYLSEDIPPVVLSGDLNHGPTKQTYVPGVALRRHDQDSVASTINVDTVAWMIVIGDALLNFIDGLSIGAAFDRTILAGISISVAIMLEEVTHRLGTFAVLIRAGMEMKQSFLYIFLSACACYPGLVLGVILGDAAEDASPYIFALAGGFFLYMALVDVMKEMSRSLENAMHKGAKSAFRIIALQNIGIIIAVIFIALLALYEREMDFEAVEIQEITDHAIE